MDRLLSQLQHRPEEVARLSAARPRQPPAAEQAWAPPPSSLNVWARVAVGATLAAAMSQWPYSHDCGFALAGYLAAVAGVFVVGAWAAHGAWRAWMGRAHLAALAIVLASVVFAAVQVVPRIGYSPVEVTWRCLP